MSKPRICKSCKWLHNRVEPCCSCSRWGKGKTDYYIPAEETLGEYLERKEREEMEKEKNIENLSTDELIKTFELCINADECMPCAQCPFKWEENCVDKLTTETLNRLKQLQQELIDERDRYDRLVSFELAEAEELRALRNLRASHIRTTPNEIFVGIDEKTLKERIQEYFAEKELQTSDVPPDQQAKADAGKLQLCMVPRQIIRDIAEVREYGNRKYGNPENWRTVEIERYRNAAFRHWLAYLDDPSGVDAESGISHLKHLACNIAFLCELEGEQ